MTDNAKYTRVIAGTMTWGSWGKKLNTKEIADLMNFCVEMGLTSFDHADIYGDYGTESDFGKGFTLSGIKREEIQLISKCGIQMVTGRNNKVAHYQYDTDYIVFSVERSLKQLQTDYLDLLLLHRPSPLMHPEDVSRAIQRLKAEGKIRQFGVSNFTPSQVALIASEIGVQANQVEYSLTHTEPMYDGTFDDCLAHNRMAMAWSPLGSFFRDNDKRQERIKKVFESLTEKYNCNESQLLLAFILKHPATVYPVVGTSQKGRLKSSFEAIGINLELQDWFIMLEASLGHSVP